MGADEADPPARHGLGSAPPDTVRDRRDPHDRALTASLGRTLGSRFGSRDALGVYGVLVAGVVAATWPLATDPAHLWPHHHDPRLFTWVMASMARWLVTTPFRLFDGNAFYPYGESLAFSEPLLVPAVLGLPGFVWGNPILTYNLLVLLLWPVNGVAMAWAAHELTGSRRAAWLAGVVFCLSPYFTEYHLEFNMLPAATVPVAIVAWVRWLETQAPRWLGVALAALALQGLTTWYYTIILGLGLAALTVGFAGLRWRGWRWRPLAGGLALGGAAVALVLAPIALPYVALHRELGFERGLGETSAHYADLLSFVEPGGRSRFLRLDLTGHVPETAPFVGFVVLALAAVSVAWCRRDPPLPRRAARLRGVVRALFALDLVAAGLAMALPPVRARAAALPFVDLAVLAGLGLLLIRGWAARRGGAPRHLGAGDWVRLLFWMTGVSAILALGPVLHVAQRPVGAGPYLGLYHVLLPLHVIRVTVRFAVLTVAGLALLAAFGLRAVEARLGSRRGVRRAVTAAVFLAVAVEYAVVPPRYDRVTAPRPVDLALRADPADVAVLEWPTYAAGADTDAMFRSLYHGKRVMNGHSGFVPESLHNLSALLTTRATPFPSTDAQAALRGVYPLKYLVVRLGDPDLPPEWGPVWRAARREAPPLLRFRGTFGSDDLYELAPLPERGLRVERRIGPGFLRGHPRLDLALSPLATDSDLDQYVEVRLDGTPVARIAANAPTTARLTLSSAHRAAPDRVVLEYGYTRRTRAGDPRYRIGGTGTQSPGDLAVTSAGEPYGRTSSIRYDGRELSPNGRGYNLVALDPSGRVHRAGVFDTFGAPDAAARLAAWVAGLPRGTIVAGAARDDASGRLTGEAVGALATLGVAGDLRGRFRQSHAFIGVKGASPGTAVEALGARAVSIAVGLPEPRDGFELTAFALSSGPASP